MRFRIRYTTRYTYEQVASDSRNELRLCPSDGRAQKRLDFHLQVTPTASISEHRDDFGNLVHFVSIGESHNELSIVADSIVDRIELLPERGPHLREYAGGYRPSGKSSAQGRASPRASVRTRVPPVRFVSKD
jgi:transglutaminase-like putative cysteine protease